MFCPDCQADLDSVAAGDPCPQCGGSRRSAVARVETIGVATAVGEVSLRITRGDRRPWTEKWQAILHSQKALDAAYSGDARPLGNTEIDGRVLTFFTECDHLRDWLTGDLAALTAVTREDIAAHFRASRPLLICNAICNSHKHHTRPPGTTTARIRETAITPNGARVTIEVDWATPRATTIDALDLANDCIESWRSFLKRFGIAEP